MTPAAHHEQVYPQDNVVRDSIMWTVSALLAQCECGWFTKWFRSRVRLFTHYQSIIPLEGLVGHSLCIYDLASCSAYFITLASICIQKGKGSSPNKKEDTHNLFSAELLYDWRLFPKKKSTLDEKAVYSHRPFIARVGRKQSTSILLYSSAFLLSSKFFFSFLFFFFISL